MKIAPPMPCASRHAGPSQRARPSHPRREDGRSFPHDALVPATRRYVAPIASHGSKSLDCLQRTRRQFSERRWARRLEPLP